MNPDSPTNQTQRVVLLALGTLGALAAIFYLAVRPLQASIAELHDRTGATLQKISASQRAARLGERFKKEVAEEQSKLDEQETGIAQGDVYRWLINAFLEFKSRYKIEFAEFEQPQISDLAIPPKIPYKGATLSVSGIATYHEFGRFLADFENQYPLIRLQSLQLDLASAIQTDPAAPGKLNFRIQVLSLVKSPPAPEAPAK